MRDSIIITSDAIEDMMMSEPESCLGRYRADSLSSLLRVLETHEPTKSAVTLDLIGHTTREAKLLRIGKTVIDLADLRVARFFERLACDHIPRLHITTLRLLGCESAVEIIGQRTMRGLARTLGVKVYGTRKMIMKTHYKPEGFDPDFAAIALIETAQLPNPPRRLE